MRAAAGLIMGRVFPLASPADEPSSSAFRSVRDALRARALAPPLRPEREAARALSALAPEWVLGVVFFGSQRTKASPDQHSAWDFVVVVGAYRPFYEALGRASRVRRPPWLLAAVNAWLPPSQISLRLPDGRGGELHAKCTIISLGHLQRETSSQRRDHFTMGRLFQPAEVLFARDDAAAEALLGALAASAAGTYTWGRPALPARFDTETYLRTLLRMSMTREIRPEPTARRADALHEAQRDEQVPVYAALLEGLARDGEVVALGTTERHVATGTADRREAMDRAGATDFFALARPVGRFERVRVGLYFRVSMIRATLRWFKYILTFDDWLDYIARKAERHTGQKIELTPRERAHPLFFLWPRLLRYLRQKDDRPRKAS
jgi:hypothetical protein